MDCGWKESVHIFKGKNLPEGDQEKLNHTLSGYYCSFWECPQYVRSKEEVAKIQRQVRELALYE